MSCTPHRSTFKRNAANRSNVTICSTLLLGVSSLVFFLLFLLRLQPQSIAVSLKRIAWYRLRQNVGCLLGRWNVNELDSTRRHHLAYVVVPYIDVFASSVQHRILRQMNRTLIVLVDDHRPHDGVAQVIEQSSKPNRLLSCRRQRHVLGFCRTQRDDSLFGTSPGDGSSAPLENVT